MSSLERASFRLIRRKSEASLASLAGSAFTQFELERSETAEGERPGDELRNADSCSSPFRPARLQTIRQRRHCSRGSFSSRLRVVFAKTKLLVAAQQQPITKPSRGVAVAAAIPLRRLIGRSRCCKCRFTWAPDGQRASELNRSVAMRRCQIIVAQAGIVLRGGATTSAAEGRRHQFRASSN